MQWKLYVVYFLNVLALTAVQINFQFSVTSLEAFDKVLCARDLLTKSLNVFVSRFSTHKSHYRKRYFKSEAENMSLQKQRITKLSPSKLSLLRSVCFLMVGLSFVHYKNDTDNCDELYCTNTSYSCNRLSNDVIFFWQCPSVTDLEWLSLEKFHWKVYGVNPCYEVLELIINHNFKFCFCCFIL